MAAIRCGTVLGRRGRSDTRRRHLRTNESAEERRCLKCRRMFASESPLNRVCDGCKKTNERVGGIYTARFR